MPPDLIPITTDPGDWDELQGGHGGGGQTGTVGGSCLSCCHIYTELRISFNHMLGQRELHSLRTQVWKKLDQNHKKEEDPSVLNPSQNNMAQAKLGKKTHLLPAPAFAFISLIMSNSFSEWLSVTKPPVLLRRQTVSPDVWSSDLLLMVLFVSVSCHSLESHAV